MISPKVFILTINHNGHNDTIELIESVKNCLYDNYSIVVIDNSSDKSSYETLSAYINSNYQDYYSSTETRLNTQRLAGAPITIIKAQNRGFAAANNIAIKSILAETSIPETDFVFILNNDTIIKTDTINNLICSYNKRLSQNIGIIAPVIYYHNTNRIWQAGGFYYKALGMLKAYHYNKKKVVSVTGEINFLTGCAWLIRKDRLSKIGPLDETFFMYGEDLDYSLKVKSKGLGLFVEPSAAISHKVGGSSNGDLSAFSAYWMMFGRIRNIKRHNNFFGKILALSVVLLSRLIAFPIYMLKNRSYLVKNQLRAIKNGLSVR